MLNRSYSGSLVSRHVVKTFYSVLGEHWKPVMFVIACVAVSLFYLSCFTASLTRMRDGVKSLVFGVCCNYKIFDPVVIPNTVSVVNHLRFCEESPEVFLHDKPMFVNSSSPPVGMWVIPLDNHDVSGFHFGSAALVEGVNFWFVPNGLFPACAAGLRFVFVLVNHHRITALAFNELEVFLATHSTSIYAVCVGERQK